jgi:hypothetical protein
MLKITQLINDTRKLKAVTVPQVIRAYETFYAALAMGWSEDTALMSAYTCLDTHTAAEAAAAYA